MMAYALYVYLSAFALFLLGFSIFMYFENRKFGDNQFTMKLLPPPPRMPAMPMEHLVQGERVKEERAKDERVKDERVKDEPLPAFSEAA